MTPDKIIVCVSSSFYQKEELINWLRKYATDSDTRFVYWNEFAFTADILPECDALLILNTPGSPITSKCYPEQVIAFMMEPGISHHHPWMYKSTEQYHKIYSPVITSGNVIPSHGFLGWYFDKDYRELNQLPFPEKTKSISCIASNLKQLAGHRSRLRFVKMLQQQFNQIDFFGKGVHYLKDKMNGLLPYRYSIAIENTSIPHYFTEKINDCFLCYTIPIYYGCKNPGDYFPEKSFIQIDIGKPEQAIKRIQSIIEHDDWESRINAVKESRELVLNKYQPLAGAADILRDIKISVGKAPIILKPVRPVLIDKIKAAFAKLIKT